MVARARDNRLHRETGAPAIARLQPARPSQNPAPPSESSKAQVDGAVMGLADHRCRSRWSIRRAPFFWAARLVSQRGVLGSGMAGTVAVYSGI